MLTRSPIADNETSLNYFIKGVAFVILGLTNKFNFHMAKNLIFIFFVRPIFGALWFLLTGV